MQTNPLVSPETVLQTAKAAALQASAVLKRYFDAPEISTKLEQTQNLVTQADVEAEAAILATIRLAFPKHSILCEESQPDLSVNGECLWIVDPLDGTTNYAHGIPQFCTSIAYAQHGQVVVGVVYDPMRDELFHAVRDGGAFLNGQPISCSSRTRLNQAVVATGFYYDRGEMMKRTLQAIESLFGLNIRGIRRFGGAALDMCWVGCGRLDAFFEYQLAPWDYAAAWLIIQEAGGRCADRNGNPLRLDSGNCVVSNEHLYDEIISSVRWQKNTIL